VDIRRTYFSAAGEALPAMVPGGNATAVGGASGSGLASGWLMPRDKVIIIRFVDRGGI
jgi:hypothetical protein